MHEMSLTESVIGIIEAEARRQVFSCVRSVVLEIGTLSCAEPESMRFCFEVVSRGTIADGAQLEIVRVPGAGWCIDCSRTVELRERFDDCPQCGGRRVQMTGGDELRIRELEVE